MGEADLRVLLERHVELFNEAVLSGDYDDFVATFADDAVMKFDGLPIGPFKGRPAIADAYASQPAMDTMALMAMETDGEDAVRASFDWDNTGGGGQMYLRWRGHELAELVVAFA
jgi:steroid Delta-isomerase